MIGELQLKFYFLIRELVFFGKNSWKEIRLQDIYKNELINKSTRKRKKGETKQTSKKQSKTLAYKCTLNIF